MYYVFIIKKSKYKIILKLYIYIYIMSAIKLMYIIIYNNNTI